MGKESKIKQEVSSKLRELFKQFDVNFAFILDVSSEGVTIKFIKESEFRKFNEMMNE